MLLKQQHCVTIRADSPRVTEEQIQELKPQIPDWRILEEGGEKRLERVFTFPDFSGALAFTTRVGEQAEAEDHHPRLVTEWGKVTLDWWTHKIHGLHLNDFIMAARTDEIYDSMKSQVRP